MRISVLPGEMAGIDSGLPTLVIAGKLNEDANVSVEFDCCPVKIEIPNRDAFVFAADPGVNRFTNDPVHASEWTNVDNAIGPLFI